MKPYAGLLALFLTNNLLRHVLVPYNCQIGPMGRAVERNDAMSLAGYLTPDREAIINCSSAQEAYQTLTGK